MTTRLMLSCVRLETSQSAFVRGVIDDVYSFIRRLLTAGQSQSAFVRGFIDDRIRNGFSAPTHGVSIRVRARLHR